MRVVHIVSEIGTYGGERFVEALVRAQRRIGIDAVIVTIYEPTRLPKDLPVLSAGRRRNGARAQGGGVGFFFSLVRTLRALRPDVVHTHLAHAKHWGRLAAVIAGAPCIVHTEHGNAFDDVGVKRPLTRLLHSRTSRVVAFSPLHAQRIVRHEHVSPDRIAIIASGIDFERVPPLQTRGKRDGATILAIGRLEPVKGYDMAIEALALLPGEPRLLIAGEGSMRESLAQQAERLGVRDRLRLLGYRSDIMALLADVDLVLNASRSEAMPLSLIEALCAGARVVTTPWPGAEELVPHGMRLSEDFSPAAIARAVEAALQAPAPSSAQTELVRNEFSIDRTALEYVNLYTVSRQSGARRSLGSGASHLRSG